MNGKRRPVKAVGLISGGLDSTLAARMLKEQGIEVLGVNFSTGFCKVDHRRAVRRSKDIDPRKLRNKALHAGAEAGIPVEIIDVSEEYLEVVTRPRHGYGRFANPCIDCRIFMLKKAKEYAETIGAEVVFTGEVLGQRPMSQHSKAFRLIEQEAGLEGRVLRPLSAKRLRPTEAEVSGAVDRERLRGLQGRGRDVQITMAERFGIQDYEQPGGGCCYLADENFARRFLDLRKHRRRGTITREDILLLKVGRHFRLSTDAKAIVGREERENLFLERLAGGRWRLEAVDRPSPLTLIDGEAGEHQIALAARVTARYADTEGGGPVRIGLRREMDDGSDTGRVGDEASRPANQRPARDDGAEGNVVTRTLDVEPATETMLGEMRL